MELMSVTITAVLPFFPITMASLALMGSVVASLIWIVLALVIVASLVRIVLSLIIVLSLVWSAEWMTNYFQCVNGLSGGKFHITWKSKRFTYSSIMTAALHLREG